MNNIDEKIKSNDNDIKILEARILENEKTVNELKSQITEDTVDLKALYQKQQILKKDTSYLIKSKVTQVKNIFNKATPFVDKIKNSTLKQAQGVKQFLDSKSLDKEWIEKKYDVYKAFCISQGQNIKSKKEFQQFMVSVDVVKNEAQELNLYDILNKLSADASDAGKAINKIVKQSNIDKKVEAIIEKKDTIFPDKTFENKYEIFTEWASHKSVNTEDNNASLYDNYLEYLSKKYPNDNLETISYSRKSGSFTKAINKFNAS